MVHHTVNLVLLRMSSLRPAHLIVDLAHSGVSANENLASRLVNITDVSLIWVNERRRPAKAVSIKCESLQSRSEYELMSANDRSTTSLRKSKAIELVRPSSSFSSIRSTTFLEREYGKGLLLQAAGRAQI